MVAAAVLCYNKPHHKNNTADNNIMMSNPRCFFSAGVRWCDCVMQLLPSDSVFEVLFEKDEEVERKKGVLVPHYATHDSKEEKQRGTLVQHYLYIMYLVLVVAYLYLSKCRTSSILNALRNGPPARDAKLPMLSERETETETEKFTADVGRKVSESYRLIGLPKWPVF